MLIYTRGVIFNYVCDVLVVSNKLNSYSANQYRVGDKTGDNPHPIGVYMGEVLEKRTIHHFHSFLALHGYRIKTCTPI